MKRLAALINEAHRRRYAPNVGEAEAARLDEQSHVYWEQIQALLKEMSSQAPLTPNALLDYAAVMLWHTTSLGLGLMEDPCEALAEASAYTSPRGYSEIQVAWGIFALAADRTQPAADWPECRPQLRDGPGTDV